MKYEKILRSARFGVYAAPRLVGPLRAAARDAGIAWIDLDLEGVTGREAFLERCAVAFALPAHFGQNWDALHECLAELAGARSPGAVVHWRRGVALAKRSPAAVKTALEVFREASMYWGSTGRAFLVVVDRDGARGLPPLR
jgi:hypothetical protein